MFVLAFAGAFQPRRKPKCVCLCVASVFLPKTPLRGIRSEPERNPERAAEPWPSRLCVAVLVLTFALVRARFRSALVLTSAFVLRLCSARAGSQAWLRAAPAKLRAYL